MLSKQELAQPVGNAKVRGEFDTDALTDVGQKTNDAVLFPRFRSDHDGNMIRLFLAGTVLARRYSKAVQSLGKDRWLQGEHGGRPKLRNCNAKRVAFGGYIKMVSSQDATKPESRLLFELG